MSVLTSGAQPPNLRLSVLSPAFIQRKNCRAKSRDSEHSSNILLPFQRANFSYLRVAFRVLLLRVEYQVQAHEKFFAP